MPNPFTTNAASAGIMPPTPPPTKPLLPITLILAATPSLGIGNAGTLPWPQLRKEMGFFARTTKRIPASSQLPTDVKCCNAVVMGRKTWDSIPKKFRPLRGRLNVVVTSRSAVGIAGEKEGSDTVEGETEDNMDGPLVASSVHDAVEKLERLNHPSLLSSFPSPSSQEPQFHIARIFITGGASIYKAALELPQARSVLLTQIRKNFECDTFFPLDLGKSGSGWRKVGKEELREFVVGEEGGGGVGDEVLEGEVEEKGVRFEVGLWVRET